MTTKECPVQAREQEEVAPRVDDYGECDVSLQGYNCDNWCPIAFEHAQSLLLERLREVPQYFTEYSIRETRNGGTIDLGGNEKQRTVGLNIREDIRAVVMTTVVYEASSTPTKGEVLNFYSLMTKMMKHNALLQNEEPGYGQIGAYGRTFVFFRSISISSLTVTDSFAPLLEDFVAVSDRIMKDFACHQHRSRPARTTAGHRPFSSAAA
jgi:hypothetical protein